MQPSRKDMLTCTLNCFYCYSDRIQNSIPICVCWHTEQFSISDQSSILSILQCNLHHANYTIRQLHTWRSVSSIVVQTQLSHPHCVIFTWPQNQFASILLQVPCHLIAQCVKLRTLDILMTMLCQISMGLKQAFPINLLLGVLLLDENRVPTLKAKGLICCFLVVDYTFESLKGRHTGSYLWVSFCLTKTSEWWKQAYSQN